MTDLPLSQKSVHWNKRALRAEIADACEAHAAKLRTPVGCEELRAAGMSVDIDSGSHRHAGTGVGGAQAMTNAATCTMCLTLAMTLDSLAKVGPVTLDSIDVQHITQTLTRAANALRTRSTEADDGSHS